MTIMIDDRPATAEQWIERIATLDADTDHLSAVTNHERLLYWAAYDGCGYTAEAIRDLGDSLAIQLYSTARAR